MDTLKLNRVQQAFKMIEALSMHSSDIEVAACRNIGRPIETVLIKKWDPKLIGWFSYENANNLANIWVRPNPEIDHPWLLLDDLPLAVANKLAGKYQCLVVETSKANCQVRLLANINLSREQRKIVQQELVKILSSKDINADYGSTAGCKWGRLPGFRNRKPNRDAWTNLLYIPDKNLSKFDPASHININQISTTEVVVCAPALNKKSSSGSGAIDQSGNDFGGLYGRLKFFKSTGRDYISESKKLEAELRDTTLKRNPEHYAKITIANILKML